MRFVVTIDDRASQAVKDLLLLQGSKAYAIGAVALYETIRDHFVMRNKVPNARNWPKTHFYDRARKQTSHSHDATSASVTVSLVGFGTHFSGKPEVILPKNSNFLTIPNRPEAYGRRAREFQDLVFAVVKNERGQMQPALVQAQHTRFRFGRKRKDGTRKVLNIENTGGDVFFWLARRVRTKPHPQALPRTEQMQSAVTKELEAYVDAL